MQIKPERFVLPLSCFFVLIFSSAVQAAVKEVTIFPNAAKVMETAKIQPQCAAADKCRAVINLPGQADPESLIVSLPANSRTRIEDVRLKTVTRQDEARISELRRQIARLKSDRKEAQAKLQSLEAQLQFWQMQTKAKTKNIAEADNLAGAIGKNVRKASQEKYLTEADIEKTDKQMKELQDELNRAAGSKETAWAATITFSGSLQNEAVISYNYTLAGCGWLPLYRIEALPAGKQVTFSWEAELWQSSGEDWKQAQINLATMQPAASVTPPDLPDWIIQQRKRRSYQPLMRENLKAEAMLEKRAALSETDEEEKIAESVKTTYSVWSIGRRNITAGDRQRLKIKEDNWPADFFFLARPALSPQAFVCAQVKFAAPVEIPPGQAIFLIDGAVLGKRDFNLAGVEGLLFFGTSPLITVTSSTLAQKAGAKTVFQNKQTQLWQWLIEANNSSGNNARIRIEEPAPQARDERIRLNFQQKPEPTEKDHTKFVWIIDVPAKQKIAIENTVELEAPKELELDLGWRR